MFITGHLTYPFLIKVLNPLVFPTCNVLHQFQSNTQLATSEVMRSESLFLPVYKEMRGLRSGKVSYWTVFIQCTLSSVWCELKKGTIVCVFWNFFGIYFGIHFLENLH